MRRIKPRDHAPTNNVFIWIIGIIRIRHAPENLANRSFGLAIRAVLEVHI